jgi:hypothetical protein
MVVLLDVAMTRILRDSGCRAIKETIESYARVKGESNIVKLTASGFY